MTEEEFEKERDELLKEYHQIYLDAKPFISSCNFPDELAERAKKWEENAHNLIRKWLKIGKQ